MFPWTDALANLEDMNMTLSYSQKLLDHLTTSLVQEPRTALVEECQAPPLMHAESIDCSRYPTAFTEARPRQVMWTLDAYCRQNSKSTKDVAHVFSLLHIFTDSCQSGTPRTGRRRPNFRLSLIRTVLTEVVALISSKSPHSLDSMQIC